MSSIFFCLSLAIKENFDNSLKWILFSFWASCGKKNLHNFYFFSESRDKYLICFIVDPVILNGINFVVANTMYCHSVSLINVEYAVHSFLQLDEAVKIKNTDIAKELCLPPVKLHCSSKWSSLIERFIYLVWCHQSHHTYKHAHTKFQY